MSRIHLKLSLYMLWGTGWDSLFFTWGYPVILHPWLKTLLFPHWIILTLWKKSTDHISEDLFLDFLSVLTLYFPFYFLALFFLNIILASLGPLHFCVDFIIILSILTLKSLLRLYWISTIISERTDILTILSLPINNIVSLPIYWNFFFFFLARLNRYLPNRNKAIFFKAAWISNPLATWWEELTLSKRPWCWEKLRGRGEGGGRGWDGWMVPLTQWTWVWANSGR